MQRFSDLSPFGRRKGSNEGRMALFRCQLGCGYLEMTHSEDEIARDLAIGGWIHENAQV